MTQELLTVPCLRPCFTLKKVSKIRENDDVVYFSQLSFVSAVSGLLAQVLKFATCELIVGSCNARQKICNWRIGIMSTVKNRDLTCIVANLWSPQPQFFPHTVFNFTNFWSYYNIFIMYLLFRDCWSFWLTLLISIHLFLCVPDLSLWQYIKYWIDSIRLLDVLLDDN